MSTVRGCQRPHQQGWKHVNNLSAQTRWSEVWTNGSFARQDKQLKLGQANEPELSSQRLAGPRCIKSLQCHDASFSTGLMRTRGAISEAGANPKIVSSLLYSFPPSFQTPVHVPVCCEEGDYNKGVEQQEEKDGCKKANDVVGEIVDDVQLHADRLHLHTQPRKVLCTRLPC